MRKLHSSASTALRRHRIMSIACTEEDIGVFESRSWEEGSEDQEGTGIRARFRRPKPSAPASVAAEIASQIVSVVQQAADTDDSVATLPILYDYSARGGHMEARCGQQGPSALQELQAAVWDALAAAGFPAHFHSSRRAFSDSLGLPLRLEMDTLQERESVVRKWLSWAQPSWAAGANFAVADAAWACRDLHTDLLYWAGVMASPGTRSFYPGVLVDNYGYMGVDFSVDLAWAAHLTSDAEWHSAVLAAVRDAAASAPAPPIATVEARTPSFTKQALDQDADGASLSAAVAGVLHDEPAPFTADADSNCDAAACLSLALRMEQHLTPHFVATFAEADQVAADIRSRCTDPAFAET